MGLGFRSVGDALKSEVPQQLQKYLEVIVIYFIL